MSNFKSWLKHNKKKVIIICSLLVIFIVFGIVSYGVISYLMPDTKESVYGDRCEVTEGYKVADERESKINEFLGSYKDMKLVDYDVKCNLIDITIEVKDSTSFSKVKEMGKKLLKVFSEDELKHYDLELIIKSDKEKSEDYPRIGTHHKEINGSMNSDFVW